MQVTDVELGSLTAEEIELIRTKRSSEKKAERIKLESTVTLADLKETDHLWVQNLSEGSSRFTDSKGEGFLLEPYNRAGSLQQVEHRFMRDPYLVRSEKRGKIRFIREADALPLLDELDYTDYSAPSNIIEDYMSEEAQESAGSRFRTKNLPETAEQRGKSITPQEVFADKTGVTRREVDQAVAQRSREGAEYDRRRQGKIDDSERIDESMGAGVVDGERPVVRSPESVLGPREYGSDDE